MPSTTTISALLLGLTAVGAVPAPEVPLVIRSMTVQIGQNAPSAGLTCPATDNGNGRNYEAHQYTGNQLTAGFKTGATMQANGKTVGTDPLDGNSNFPHSYGNREGFNFSCSYKDYMEFALQTDGQTYDGGDVTNQPDRVIWSYKASSNTLNVNFCGAIRHGPGQDFLECV